MNNKINKDISDEEHLSKSLKKIKNDTILIVTSILSYNLYNNPVHKKGEPFIDPQVILEECNKILKSSYTEIDIEYLSDFVRSSVALAFFCNEDNVVFKMCLSNSKYCLSTEFI